MELFKLLGTIAVDNSSAVKGMNETADTAQKTGESMAQSTEKAEGRMSGALSRIGQGAIAVGKVVAVGIGTGVTAIGALAKTALGSYADYEQLVGGVETLFKDASGKLMGYANEAYKTAGLSANEYMETVTSFSASLIQSLNGDTAKASEVANQAIIDMSDNANKMGTSIESIQNAYQGFAKQNYTMLDNLKLGYGGTKEEMARLLKDAKAISGIEYDISSYADVVEAIHVIQNEMGIAGATRNEAFTTITGSLTAMKSAWKNLITGIADDNQDLDALIGNFVESAGTAVENIMPRLEIILNGIGEMVTRLVPVIADKLPVLIESLLPALLTGAVALFNGLVSSLPEILTILIEQLPFILTQIGQGLIDAFPALLQTCKDLFGQIWDYIAVELLGTSNDFESTLSKVTVFFQNAWGVLQTIWATVGQPIFDMIQNVIGIVGDAFASRMPEIESFVSTAFSDIAVFWENNLKPCLEAIGNFIENILAPTVEAVFNGYIAPAIDTAFKFIKNLWEDTLKPVFVGITDFLTGVFTLNFEQAWLGIKSILGGILNGIISGIEYMINQAINAINGLIGGINFLISKAGELVGLEIAIPTISNVSLPRLEKGGVLEKGQIGLLEGNGAEAVVPLDQNEKWINRVAQDMNSAVGGNEAMYKLLDVLNSLPDEIAEAIASMRFEINNREFARLVKGV